MKTRKNSPDYSKLLSEYPETEKLMKVFAAEGDEPEVDFVPEMPSESEPVTEPGETPEGPAPEGESDDAEQLFNPEEMRNDLMAAFQQHTLEELTLDNGAGAGEYALMIDSLGEAEQAASFLELEGADAASIIETANNELAGMSEALELPGKFEVLESEPDPEAEEPEPVTYDIYFSFTDEDLDKLIELGFEFASSAEASFDEIISSLSESGHADVARRIYDILNPVRKH